MKQWIWTMMISMVGLLVLWPGGALAQANDPASVVAAFTTASDLATRISLVADDVTLRIIPPPAGQSGVWTGLAQARQFIAFQAAQNGQRRLLGQWQVSGNTVSGTVMVTNKSFEAWHVSPVEHTLVATVINGKITAWTVTMVPSERTRVAAGRAAAQQSATLPMTGGGVSTSVWLWLVVLAVPILILGRSLQRRASRGA